jgi:predicted alpha/beta-hydrolase family hydrolase
VSRSKSPEAFAVAIDVGVSVGALQYPAGQPTAGATLVFAHGAGAGQRSPFIVSFASAMSAFGFDVVTFDFPYMAQKRRIPDKAPVLEACYGVVVHATRARVASAGHALFIGGKSMGGRIATQLAAVDRALPIDGLVLLGYPLHPPGRPGQRRDAHLPKVGRPMLVVQGSRDTFGTPDELTHVVDAVGPSLMTHVIDGGDHSFRIARAASDRQSLVYDDVQRTAAEWMRRIIRSRGASLEPSR